MLWRIGKCFVWPRAQPEGTLEKTRDGRRVLRVLNLRGHRTPEYILPENASYMSLFVKGGPHGNIGFKALHRAVHYIQSTPRECVCVVHCEHGLNRTGAVVCAWALAMDARRSVDEVLAKFATTHPPGVQRDWVRSTLTRWKCHLEQKFAQTHRASFRQRTPRCSDVDVASRKCSRVLKFKRHHVRKHRPTLHDHRSATHSGQHTQHVEGERRGTLQHAHTRLRHGHGNDVQHEIHARSPAQASRASKQKEEIEKGGSKAEVKQTGDLQLKNDVIETRADTLR